MDLLGARCTRHHVRGCVVCSGAYSEALDAAERRHGQVTIGGGTRTSSSAIKTGAGVLAGGETIPLSRRRPAAAAGTAAISSADRIGLLLRNASARHSAHALPTWGSQPATADANALVQFERTGSDGGSYESDADRHHTQLRTRSEPQALPARWMTSADSDSLDSSVSGSKLKSDAAAKAEAMVEVQTLAQAAHACAQPLAHDYVAEGQVHPELQSPQTHRQEQQQTLERKRQEEARGWQAQGKAQEKVTGLVAELAGVKSSLANVNISTGESLNAAQQAYDWQLQHEKYLRAELGDVSAKLAAQVHAFTSERELNLAREKELEQERASRREAALELEAIKHALTFERGLRLAREKDLEQECASRREAVLKLEQVEQCVKLSQQKPEKSREEDEEWRQDRLRLSQEVLALRAENQRLENLLPARMAAREPAPNAESSDKMGCANHRAPNRHISASPTARTPLQRAAAESEASLLRRQLHMESLRRKLAEENQQQYLQSTATRRRDLLADPGLRDELHREQQRTLVATDELSRLKSTQLNGANLLLRVCRDQIIHVVCSLVESGVDVNQPEPDDAGWTPLMHAANADLSNLVSCLVVECGADLEAVALSNKLTALAIAAKANASSCVKVLLEYGAKPEAVDAAGATALMHAAASNSIEAMEVLLTLQPVADVNRADDRGCTALMWAAKQGCEDAVLLLLKQGADICRVDQHAKSAIDWAAAKSRSSQSWNRLKMAMRRAPTIRTRCESILTEYSAAWPESIRETLLTHAPVARYFHRIGADRFEKIPLFLDECTAKSELQTLCAEQSTGIQDSIIALCRSVAVFKRLDTSNNGFLEHKELQAMSNEQTVSMSGGMGFSQFFEAAQLQPGLLDPDSAEFTLTFERALETLARNEYAKGLQLEAQGDIASAIINLRNASAFFENCPQFLDQQNEVKARVNRIEERLEAQNALEKRAAESTSPENLEVANDRAAFTTSGGDGGNWRTVSCYLSRPAAPSWART